MLRTHPAAGALKDLLTARPGPAASAAVLDDTSAADTAAAEEAAAKAAKEAKEQEEAAEAEAKRLAAAANAGGGDAALDAAAAAAAAKAAALDAASAGAVLDAASAYQDSDTALKAVAAVQEWAETTAADLDEGEGSGDRLFSLLAGIADDNLDGEITEDEADIINAAANAAADYMIAKGVPEADAVALLEDFDNDLAEQVQDLVLSSLPDGDADAAAEIDAFVFGDGSDESALDSASPVIAINGVNLDSVTFGKLNQKPEWMQMTCDQIREFATENGMDPKVLDATYRKKLVVRRGKKVRINKRVSGHVRLTAKQKVSVRKMLRKSHSAMASARRARSMRVRARSGLTK